VMVETEGLALKRPRTDAEWDPSSALPYNRVSEMERNPLSPSSSSASSSSSSMVNATKRSGGHSALFLTAGHPHATYTATTQDALHYSSFVPPVPPHHYHQTALAQLDSPRHHAVPPSGGNDNGLAWHDGEGAELSTQHAHHLHQALGGVPTPLGEGLSPARWEPSVGSPTAHNSHHLHQMPSAPFGARFSERFNMSASAITHARSAQHKSPVPKQGNAMLTQTPSPLQEGSTSPHVTPPGGQQAGQNQVPNLLDITELLHLPQNEAAARLNMSNATFSKRFRQSNENKRWPFRALQVIEKQLKEAHAKDQKAIVSALEEKKRLLLAPAFISQKK